MDTLKHSELLALSDDEQAQVMHAMTDEERARLLISLPPADRSAVLANMSPEDRESAIAARKRIAAEADGKQQKKKKKKQANEEATCSAAIARSDEGTSSVQQQEDEHLLNHATNPTPASLEASAAADHEHNSCSTGAEHLYHHELEPGAAGAANAADGGESGGAAADAEIAAHRSRAQAYVVKRTELEIENASLDTEIAHEEKSIAENRQTLEALLRAIAQSEERLAVKKKIRLDTLKELDEVPPALPPSCKTPENLTSSFVLLYATQLDDKYNAGSIKSVETLLQEHRDRLGLPPFGVATTSEDVASGNAAAGQSRRSSVDWRKRLGRKSSEAPSFLNLLKSKQRTVTVRVLEDAFAPARDDIEGNDSEQPVQPHSMTINEDEWVRAGLSADEFNFLDTDQKGHVDPRDLLFNDTLAANGENFGQGFFGRAVAVPVDRWARIGRWKKMMNESGGFQYNVGQECDEESNKGANEADDTMPSASLIEGEVSSPKRARSFSPNEIDSHWADIERRKAIDKLVRYKITEANPATASWRAGLDTVGVKHGRGIYDKEPRAQYQVKLTKTPKTQAASLSYDTLLTPGIGGAPKHKIKLPAVPP